MSIESYVNITTRPWSCFREKHSHRKISAEESTTDATLRKFFRFVTQSTAQINTAHTAGKRNSAKSLNHPISSARTRHATKTPKP